jgi:arginyl-tRNA synthetase
MAIDSYISDSIISYLCSEHSLNDVSVQLSVPKQKDHGDYATNAALMYAKKIGLNPRQLAEKIKSDIAWNDDIEGIEIAGPGFLNFKIARSSLYSILEKIHTEGATFGTNNSGAGKKTNVEFVSANPTGPLTVGHARNAVLGDTFARILEANGYAVDREYYFNNAGRQMRMLGHSVYFRYMQMIEPDTEFGEDYYQGDYIKDIAEKIFTAKGTSLKGDQDNPIFKETAEAEIFLDIQQSLKKIDIKHDLFYNENSLYDSGKIEAILAEFDQKGLTYKEKDAIWLKTTDLGFEQDKVVVKATGEPTYRLPDMAYHKDKFDRGYDVIVDIFGADHIDTYPDVLAAVKELGYDVAKIKVIIYQFVTLLRNGEVVKMSTRAANYITLDELVDEVGADVVRYFINMRSVNTHLNFDLDLAKKQSDENPVFYVQYAHARICSILRRANEKGLRASGDHLDLLIDPAELDLIKQFTEYPKLLRKLAENLEQHKLCTFLFELAGVYHRFNQQCKVVDTDEAELSSARLYLIESAKQVFANGFGILGITAPEQM